VIHVVDPQIDATALEAELIFWLILEREIPDFHVGAALKVEAPALQLGIGTDPFVSYVAVVLELHHLQGVEARGRFHRADKANDEGGRRLGAGSSGLDGK
jgi:hypothetical protein